MSRNAKADLADYDDYEEADEYPEARATTTRKRSWRSYDEDYGPPSMPSRGGGGGGGTGGIFKSAAIEVLNQEKRLMATGEITRVALERKLLHCQGKTPDATMASALYTDVRKRGGSSPFIKPKQGLFGLKAWLDEPWLQDWLQKEGIELADFLPEDSGDYEGHARSSKSARKTGGSNTASGARASRRNTSRVNYAAYETAAYEEEEEQEEEELPPEEEEDEDEEEYAEEGDYGGRGAHAHSAYTAAYRHANDVGNQAYQSTYVAAGGASRSSAATAAAGTSSKAGSTTYTYTAGRQPLALPNNIYSQANLPAALYNMQNLQAAAALAAVSSRSAGGAAGGASAARPAGYYQYSAGTTGQQ